MEEQINRNEWELVPRNSRTIIMDVTLIPNYYEEKEMSLKELVQKYEKEFGIKIIPVDSSKLNNSTPVIMPL